MPRHKFTREECQKGGRNLSREKKSEGGKKGFDTTMERHPFMFNYLKYAPGMKKFKEGVFHPDGKS